jgi:prolyl 4-hydroxylase
MVLTAVLHVDDNVPSLNTEPWVYELIGHDGIPHNVTTRPGEMLLYEGTSVIHGRPYPLQGTDNTYMAYLYMHFEPVGYTHQYALHNSHRGHGQDDDSSGYGTTIMGMMTTKDIDRASKELFEKALLERNQESSSSSSSSSSNSARSGVPRYIWPGCVDMYRQRSFVYQFEETVYPKPAKVVFGQITAHQAASLGDLRALKEIARADRTELFRADMNGWRPIHEAARSGYADVLEYLLEEGAQVNQRTNNNLGGNPLYWAEKEPTKNAEAIKVLKRYGGINLPPVAEGERKKAEQKPPGDKSKVVVVQA